MIGNGDVTKPEDARALAEETGCDAVMIGRAAPTNPWIFRQMAEYFSAGAYASPSEADRYQLIRDYYAMLVEEEMPGAIGKMKQFASWFTHGVEGGAKLRKAIYEAKSAAAIVDAVDQFFGQPEAADTDGAEAVAEQAAATGAAVTRVATMGGDGAMQ